DGSALEAEVVLEVLGDLTNKTLEGQLADQELSALLVFADLTKSDGTRAVSVRLLDASSGGGRFAGSLGGELFARSFASGGFTSSLFSASHLEWEFGET